MILSVAGHPHAMCELAHDLESSDLRASIGWYERGAPEAADDGVCWRRLGVLRLTGRASVDGTPEYTGALEAFIAAACRRELPDGSEVDCNRGDADAAYNLGRMLEWRQVNAFEGGAEALRSRLEAAAPGSVDLVRPTDEWEDAAAVYFYTVAAERGLVLGRAHLARRLAERGELAAACSHYTVAAEAGDADSAWELAQMLHEGRGCRQDADAAGSWVVRAAEAGHPAAQAMLSG